jgi:hypothetical protein
MATARKITDFIAYGTHAARPAAPTLGTGEIAVYYETDTLHMFAYVSGAWVQIDGTAAPAVVQVKSVAGTIGAVTLSAAPTAGNLMLAITTDVGVSEAAAAGWTQAFPFVAAGADGAGFYWKVAGVAESATQTPTSSTATGSVTIFEIANATPAALRGLNLDLTGTALAASCSAAHGALVIGVACCRANVTPTSITGGTVIAGGANSASRSAQPFKVTAPAQGTNTVTVNYAASQGAAIPMIEVG